MLIENSELQTSFELPEPLTVRDVLRYDGAVERLIGAQLYERLWAGVQALAKDWKSPVALDVDLDKSEDMTVIEVIKFAGLVTFGHIQTAKQTPKNS